MVLTITNTYPPATDLTGADPAVLVMSVAFLFATGLIAGYVPAWRASRVDPMVSLRYE